MASLAHEIARFHYFAGHVDEVEGWVERSLAIAESLWLPEVLSQALNTKSLLRRSTHPEEAMALITWALRIAEEQGLNDAFLRGTNNLGVLFVELDRYEEAVHTFERQLELARKLGMRQPELVALSSLMSLHVDTGGWDEALELAERLLPEGETAARDVSDLLKITVIHAARGEPERGRKIVDAYAPFATSEEAQMRAAYDAYLAVQLLAEGDPSGAQLAAERAIGDTDSVGVLIDSSKWAMVLSLSAAAASGDLDRVRALLDRIEAIPPGLRSPMYRAQATRFQARLAAVEGGADPSPLFRSAAAQLRELGTPFSLAIVLLEHSEWLVAAERAGEAASLLDEARGIFARLKARPWLERADAVLAAETVATA